jgi:hypothetical protein
MAELERLMQSDPKLRDMMEKLSQRPSAILAMQNVGKIVQSKGSSVGQYCESSYSFSSPPSYNWRACVTTAIGIVWADIFFGIDL